MTWSWVGVEMELGVVLELGNNINSRVMGLRFAANSGVKKGRVLIPVQWMGFCFSVSRQQVTELLLEVRGLRNGSFSKYFSLTILFPF